MLPEPALTPVQCLDALESNLRTVLLHTGSALSDPANFESAAITQTKARITKHLPDALDEFQYALRQLELELIRAKSVLQRDLAASRGVQQASAANTASVSSPQPIDLDNDTVMIEAPRPHSDSISHVFGPPTPDPKAEEPPAIPNGNTTADNANPSTNPPEDDPFEHPKPIEFNAHEAKPKDNHFTDPPPAGSDNLAKGSSSGDGNEDSGQAVGNNTSDADDLSLLLGVELYASGDHTNGSTGDNVQPSNENSNQNNNAAGEQGASQNTDNMTDLTQLPESLDFDDINNLFAFDGDDMTADGMNQGGGTSGGDDVHVWDNSVFDDNFFHLDVLDQS